MTALPSGPARVATAFSGWRMIAIAFLCQNIATGFLFGTFGTTFLAVQERFHAGRATVSLGISLALLALGVLSPLTAKMLERVTLRHTMSCGILLYGCGFLILALAPNIWTMLGAYALLIGPGFAMFGPLPSTILASNWFHARQGTAIGFVCVPLFTALAPLLSVAILDRFGLTILYLGMAACILAMLPLVLTVVERPALVGQQAYGQLTVPSPAVSAEIGRVAPPISLIASRPFWAMVVGGGTMMAVGIIAISHVVPLAIERGLSEVQASLLISVIGGTSMLGALFVGSLCDRLGASRTLALVAAGFCLAWGSIFISTRVPVFVIAVVLHGICSGGVFPAVGVLSRHLFGGEAMARAIGLFYLLTLPFTFFFPPIVGWIRDTRGNYDSALALVVLSSGLVSAVFCILWQVERRASRGLYPASSA